MKCWCAIMITSVTNLKHNIMHIVMRKLNFIQDRPTAI